MKLKVAFLFIAFMGVSLGVALVQSCNPPHKRVCRMEVMGIGEPSSSRDKSGPDTLIYNMGFQISAYSDELCYVMPAFGISACYALTICTHWENEIVDSSFQLTLDRPVVLAGDTLAPGTDLFQQPLFVSGIRVRDLGACKSIGYELVFTSNLIHDMDFEPGTYTATITCSTDDNKVLTDSRQVVFSY